MAMPYSGKSIFGEYRVTFYWAGELHPTICEGCQEPSERTLKEDGGMYAATKKDGSIEFHFCKTCFAEYRDGARAHCGMPK